MKTLTSILWALPFVSFAQWSPLGNQIVGSESSGNLGQSVSMNGSGQIIALGAPGQFDANNIRTGQVEVYELQANTWTLKGSVIDGLNSGDRFGIETALSDNGEVLAIGAPGFVTQPTTAGYASVYAFDGTNWLKRGADLMGTTPDDSYGTSISLNADGSIVAVAAEPFLSPSYIRVFQWDGTVWNQLGTDITTGLAGDGFGRWIDLSSNGLTLIASAVNHDLPLKDNGRAMVYEYNGVNWVQKGSDLIGDGRDDFFGAGLAIGNNGNTIVVGARDDVFNMSKGYVKVFDWSGSNWIQKGSTLFGSTGGDFFGDVNDINSAGDIIISGSVLGNYAKVHQFQASAWVLLDSISISGGIQFGNAVGLNSAGDKAIIGDFSHLANGVSRAGLAAVFENNSLGVDKLAPEFELHIFPNPAANFIKVESDLELESYRITSLNGSLVKAEFVVNQSDFTIDLSEIKPGLYMVEFVSGLGIKRQTFLKD